MTQKPHLHVGSGPETIRVLKAELARGTLPNTYVSAGALVHMETISGGQTSPATDEDSPLSVTASPITPATLAGLLAEHAYVYRIRSRKNGNGGTETYEEEVTPPRDILASVLAGKTWPDLAPLRGVIRAPCSAATAPCCNAPGTTPPPGCTWPPKSHCRPSPTGPPPNRWRAPATSC